MNSDNTIKRLENEVTNLKKSLERHSEQSLKIWERDLYIEKLIDDVLKEPELKHALKVLNIIKQGLTNPEDFKAPSTNKEEVDKLTQEIENLQIKNQDNLVKLDLAEKTVNNLNTVIADLKKLSDDNKECYEKRIKELEIDCAKSKKELTDIKANYENKLTDLIYKNDKLTEENNFRKFQLKNHEENTIKVNKENGQDNYSKDKMAVLLITNARLEGKLLNKEKELKAAWDKVEYYRNLACK